MDLRGFVSERLKTLREERGYQRTELASRAGVSRDVIRKIETAETSPTLETIHQIAQALRVSLAEFFAAPTGTKEEQAISQLAAYLADKRYEHIRLVDQIARLTVEQLEQPLHQTSSAVAVGE